VRFKNEPDVQRAIDEFNGIELEGRNITVKVDQFA
jgi:RNA recognition motif-containing protein